MIRYGGWNCTKSLILRWNKIVDFETPKIPSTILECELEPEKYYKLKKDRKIKRLQ
jgi:hypothetical protein